LAIKLSNSRAFSVRSGGLSHTLTKTSKVDIPMNSLEPAQSSDRSHENGESADDPMANLRSEIYAPNEKKEVGERKNSENTIGGDKIGPVKPGETSLEQITLPNGDKADYRLHVPKDYDGQKPLPLVIMFHGYGIRRGQGDTEKGAEGMEEVSALSKLADKEGFIAVYPDGNPDRSYSWNNGQWFFSGRDDTAFTKGMMDTVGQNLNVDKERVYIIGYSQGGSFTHKVANQLSERVAAVVENGGWMTGKEKPATSPFPVMAIQSLTDNVARAEGSPWYNITMKPEAYTQDFYKKANGLSGEPTITSYEGKDGSEVKDVVWKNPNTGVEVKTLFLNNQKHLWFGGKGAEDSPINATEEAWNFLKRFRKVVTND